MKIIKSNLSLLLVITILFSMVVSATSVSAAEPTKLLELDMSGLEAVALTPSATSGEVTSGITKSGSLASSTTLSFSKRPDGENTITKKSFPNGNGGTTYYMDYFDKMIWPNYSIQGSSYVNHTMNVQFNNKELELTDNTISFWVDVTASHYLKEIVCYRVDYTTSSGASHVRTFDLGINPDNKWHAFSESEKTPDVYKTVTSGTFDVPQDWKHVVITNPKAANGSKTLSVYVNGEFKKSVTLDIPADATVKRANVSFFGKSSCNEEYWRIRWHHAAAGILGGIRVYDGAMSAQDASALYKAQLPEFTYTVEPTKLLELDMSNLSAEKADPSDTLGEVTSGIVKSGSLAETTTLSFSARTDGENTIMKKSFSNTNGGTTYYLDYFDSKIYPNIAKASSYGNHTMNLQFDNKNLESTDSTISFWVDVTPSHYLKQIAAYRLDYTKSDGNASVKTFDLAVNPDGTWNAFSETWVTDTNHPAVTDGAFSVPEGWKHVVITNPKSTNNSKTLKLYINGEFKKEVTLPVPSDATINHANVSFFGKSTENEKYWRARWHNAAAGTLGGIRVFDAAMSALDVSKLYKAQLPEFTAEIIKFVNGNGEKVENLGSLSEVTLKYESDKAASCYVACYDASKNLLFADTMEAGNNTLTIAIPAGTDTIKGFAWNWKDDNTILPLIKACVLNKE